VRDRHERSTNVHALRAPRRATVQEQLRWTAVPHDLDVLPEDAAGVPRAERFHGRLFGGEPSSQVRRGVAAPRTISNLARREHALQEAVTITLENRGEPGNVGRVEADAEDVHA